MNNPNYLFPLTVVFAIGLFITACTQPTEKPDPMEFSTMTYNLRFDNPDDGQHTWDNRKDRVINLINFYEPAFLGTQEGLLHQLNYISDNLTYYDWIGVGRDDGSMNGEFSALFYNTTRFELIEGSEQTIWLSDTPSEPSKNWDAALPRILTYGQFRDKSTDKEFVVLNTHFDHVGDTARIESAKLIVETIRSNFEDKPVILTGDFNATPNSKPYDILTRDASTLHDAFEISRSPNVGPDFTFEGFEVQSSNNKRRIDYIFVNNKVNVQKHGIISSFNGDSYPSDHLPVIAVVSLRE